MRGGGALPLTPRSALSGISRDPALLVSVTMQDRPRLSGLRREVMEGQGFVTEGTSRAGSSLPTLARRILYGLGVMERVPPSIVDAGRMAVDSGRATREYLDRIGRSRLAL